MAKKDSKKKIPVKELSENAMKAGERQGSKIGKNLRINIK